MKTLLRTLAGLTAAGAATVAYASVVERNAFVLRRVTAPVLPRGQAPLRVLHLSDMHLVPGQERKVEWVRSLAALEPDLVVNTGDNLAHLQAVPVAMRALEPLLELPGAFVMGSNDYLAPHAKNPFTYFTSDHARVKGERRTLPTGDLIAGFETAGWVNLNNHRSTLEVDGRALELIGVDDPHIRRDRYEEVAGPADPDADLTVGIAHAPYLRTLDAFAHDGARLIIAGHTHGGQVCVPFYGALVTNCDLGTERVKGLSRWWEGCDNAPSDQAPTDAAWLNVSAGLGTSPFAPVRLACRPEATLLTLRARS
ncbi:metallophosphoesterase [Arsenicicoccus sp. oral taxon 190]|uniref:metallophosphoesterase n=1 Tax=Arsenicicoccus sp. oral taxon 190 TaxID=1658671 RepID=UPI00067A351C|nr:metallophosphoesterase [Arsenicicoccus sp. oral taxon 190]AKT50473.1 metallophosphoesterase [Arsenicicoccus sp. oral taxon 190]